jgi:hypothetical protein
LPSRKFDGDHGECTAHAAARRVPLRGSGDRDVSLAGFRSSPRGGDRLSMSMSENYDAASRATSFSIVSV